MFLLLTRGRDGTDAEGRRGGREAELIQNCIGPRRINHRDITAGGGARNHPHRTLQQRRRLGVMELGEMPGMK